MLHTISTTRGGISHMRTPLIHPTRSHHRHTKKGNAMSTCLITTTIPYANARPHIGFALELVQADTLARWHRQKGDDVKFLTGTDENAIKNMLVAKEHGLTPRELCDQNTGHSRHCLARSRSQTTHSSERHPRHIILEPKSSGKRAPGTSSNRATLENTVSAAKTSS